MITIKSISEVTGQEYDEVWAIVRKLKSNPNNFRHVEDLSPSLELLNNFITLRENGKWDRTSFNEIYLPAFLKEISSNPRAQELLNELCNRDMAGERIALVCYCPNENICHRSIIAGILQGMKANVIAENDYGKYYEMHKDLKI